MSEGIRISQPFNKAVPGEPLTIFFGDKENYTIYPAQTDTVEIIVAKFAERIHQSSRCYSAYPRDKELILIPLDQSAFTGVPTVSLWTAEDEWSDVIGENE